MQLPALAPVKYKPTTEEIHMWIMNNIDQDEVLAKVFNGIKDRNNQFIEQTITEKMERADSARKKLEKQQEDKKIMVNNIENLTKARIGKML